MVTLLKRHRPRVNLWPGSLLLIFPVYLKNKKTHSVPVGSTLKDTITRKPWRSHKKYRANFKKQNAEITKLQRTGITRNMWFSFLSTGQGHFWRTSSEKGVRELLTTRHWFCVQSSQEEKYIPTLIRPLQLYYGFCATATVPGTSLGSES